MNYSLQYVVKSFSPNKKKQLVNKTSIASTMRSLNKTRLLTNSTRRNETLKTNERLVSCFDAVKNISGVFADTFAKSCLQELEDQLHEEENKVSGLNKAKAKLERDLDEVRIFFTLNVLF